MFKRFFSRLWLKVIVSILRAIRKEDEIPKTPFEKSCLINCRKTIRDPQSELLICPVTNKRYINNSTSELFIIITSAKVEIINHTFYYPIPLSVSGQKKLVQVFNGNVAIRRQLMEDKIMANIQRSLNKVFEKV